MRKLPLLVVLASLASSPATAQAAGWSHPQGYTAGTQSFDEPVARVAVAEDGTSIATFAKDRDLYAVTGDRRGRFSAPRKLGRWASITSVVAAGRGGAALAAWEGPGGLHVAVRTRAGRRLRTRLLVSSTAQAINDLAVVHDPRGGWFILEHEFSDKTHHDRVRGLTLKADGTLALSPQILGAGSFGADANPVRALAVDDRGDATAIFSTPTGPVTAQSVHAGHFGPRHPFGDAATTAARVTAPRSSVDGALVAATSTRDCGDAGCFGQPVAARVTPQGDAPAFQVPVIEHPGRAFGPSIAPLGPGAAALVFSLKDGPSAFSRLAPVKAVVLRDGARPGPLQTLTTKNASEPIAATLSRSRVLVLWSGARGFGTAIAGPDGIFHKTAQPPGPPPEPYHTNPTNRAISTAGPYALVGWSRAGRVRLSLRRF
ncbi:MAG TPA: hypothetical protein VL120_16065 [Solirubrobacteraceae bacterium]|jgi:hypothetical protein|nr:hypothetical protein [Solirubrobacteraceae bacterium]